MQVGKTYKIKSDIYEDEEDKEENKQDNKPQRKYKFIPAKLLKEFENFYLFQTKHYKTTIHKQDSRFIREV